MASVRDQCMQDDKPMGIRVLEYAKKAPISLLTHQVIVLIVTFFAYGSFRATRKTMSVAKNALNPQSSDMSLGFPPSSPLNQNHHVQENQVVAGSSGWAPFNGSDGSALLSELDAAFLLAYALGMFFSGHIADRMNLRKMLTAGTVGTGLFTLLLGVAYWANIHNFDYFLVVQILSGLIQSTGWPATIAVVGNWFGKRKRGLIMGIWNSNTSVGDITGSLMASALLPYGWGWSFAVQGLLSTFLGVVVFLILPVNPESVGARDDRIDCDDEVEESLLRPSVVVADKEAVGFIEACRIPGVVPFALCLFFAKLVAYTFLYWLPFYISHTTIAGEYLSSSAAGNLSTLFDLGGVVGGVLAGHISDQLNAPATTAATFIYCAIPALFLYRSYGYLNLPANILLMFVAGMLVNGPYTLITTAVSADLGNHEQLKGNSRAIATVAAIIDGTGSVGAAVGPFLTGYMSEESWTSVFIMLMLSALVSGLLLTRLVVTEVAAKVEELRSSGPAETS